MKTEIDEQFFVKQVLESIDSLCNTVPCQGQLTKKHSNRYHSQILSKSYSVTRERILSHVQIEKNAGQLIKRRVGLLSLSNIATKKDIAAYKSEIESHSHLRGRKKSSSGIRTKEIATQKNTIKSHYAGKDVYAAIETAEKVLFQFDQDQGKSVPNRIKEFIRDALCPSLLKTSDDVFEIAKVSTPTLLTLSLSGTISLPIQPVFFAAAAILLARSSIAKICKDTNPSKPE